VNTKLTEIYEAIRQFPATESIGMGDPEEIGTMLFKFVAKCVHLNTDMRILDLGCGLGRSSIPFVDYLSGGGGHLVGVDVIERMVSFCRDVIGSRYSNASFHSCAVPESYLINQQRNNPPDLLPVKEILVHQEPFDLINAFSVFTHLLPDEMDAYFSLFERILKPDGRMVLTFLFLDEWTRPKIRDRALPTSPSNPRAAVAIALDDVLAMAKAHGFQPEQIHLGSWRAMPSETFQDVLILQREQSIPVDFDPKRYLALHKDVARSGIDPVQHYLVWGKHEGRAYK
jgi:SAM-dependent methyltransferase